MSSTTNPIKVKIGDVTLPFGLHTTILSRFLKEKELMALYDSYSRAKITIGMESRPPTELQVKMAKLLRTGKKTKEVATTFNTTYSVVAQAVRRVAIWEYMNEQV